MKPHEPEHAALVEAWLKEPIGLPEIDTARTAQLVHLTPQQRGWLRPLIARRSHTMFSATKLVAAGIIVAAFGGFLLSTGTLKLPDAVNAPAAITAAPSANAVANDPTPEASPTGEVEAMPESETPADALVLGASSGQSVAGWTEVGRISITDGDIKYGEMRHLQAIGERLVAIGSYHGPAEGPIHDVIYHSVDGISWVPAEVPGNEPSINDLAATAEGLLAAGSDKVDGADVARIWSSPDGIDWTEVAAPTDLKRIDQIVSTEEPLIVRGGRQLWADNDGSEWTLANRLGKDMSALKGPGGFLLWQFTEVATVLHSTDLMSGSTEVGLPVKLSKGGSGVVSDMQIFATDDLWVLVPHVLSSPDAIYTSPDGIEWTEAPRPPGIVAGAVRWMADIDGQVQALGAVDGDDTDAAGIWTFVPGEPVADPEIMDRADEFIDTPVAFGDGYAATGLKMGRDWQLTTWERSVETND